MDLRQLRYFVAVAEELHFGRAAERVHIAQPALSMQIKALEEDLGVQLLARTNRSVALTEPGRLFLAEAKATLAQAARSVEVAKRALRGDLGSIRIAYSGSAAYTRVLGRALQNFRQLYPAVEIQLLELAPSEQLGSLQTRSIHVGFLTTLALDLPDNLVALKLATWPLRIAVPSSHALARLKEIPLEVLRNEPFVVYAGSGADDGLSVLRSLVGFTPKVSHRVTNAMMLAALVGAEMGFALIPASLANVAAQMGVTLKAIADFRVDMDVSLAHQRQESEPVVLRFLECVRRVFDVE